jgi:hypothetical protein
LQCLGIGEEYTIRANYTGTFPSQEQDDEYELSYFREDVGLNEFYFYFTCNSPFWMEGNKHNVKKGIRGELYYYVHKMLLNRYKLERLSHGIREMEDINWQEPIVTGYYPRMTHFNGIQLPIRETNAHIPIQKYKYLEARIPSFNKYTLISIAFKIIFFFLNQCTKSGRNIAYSFILIFMMMVFAYIYLNE